MRSLNGPPVFFLPDRPERLSYTNLLLLVWLVQRNALKCLPDELRKLYCYKIFDLIRCGGVSRFFTKKYDKECWSNFGKRSKAGNNIGGVVDGRVLILI
jgi:hypothetical protein